MKTNNNNSKTNFSWANIVVFIFSLIGISLIINWISEKVSTWIVDLIFPEEAKKKAAVKSMKPVLKESIKNVKPIKFADLEKTMGSLNKVVKEVVDENLVPENIREKIESYEEAQKASGTKTIINGKISSKADQFIYDCKQIKRDRIGSHKVIVGDKNIAKKIKAELTKSENEFVKFYKDMGHDPDRLSCLNFMDGYFTWVNEYIDQFDCYCDKVSFEETDAIINKYFGEI